MTVSIKNIIPKPVFATELKGSSLVINRRSLVASDEIFKKQAEYLSDLFYQQTDIRLRVLPLDKVEKEQVSVLLIRNTHEIDKPEMYSIKAVANKIEIQSKDISGIVYGIHTLVQLVPLKKVTSVTISPFEIQDYPRFSYRGMHLDVSRHFYKVDYVKKYIDYLSHHKFNYFHWHLTDDQGWRIEIKSYPKLTSIGAWRSATLIGHFFDEPALYYENEYGGFYTQQEVKEVIEYAKIRGITIIPEIDIPGHCRAVIASYPELGTQPEVNYEVATTWGMFNRQNNVLAPRKETFEFIEKVFAEICDLFPAPYIHIGGDECSKMWWEESEQAQEFIKKHHLEDEKGLQTYIVNKTAKYLESRNKKVIAWHDVLEGNAATSVIIMNWGTQQDAEYAINKGYRLIATPGKPLYFDHYQKEEKHEALAIHGFNSLEAVYEFDPVPESISGTAKKDQVLGAQANVWTEYIGTTSKLEYMIFPRMTALCEVLWSPEKARNFRDFRERLLLNSFKRYQLWGASFCEIDTD
jgi:hexosaminidase